jgi:transcriptional regulator with XRE-family HTH domain
MTATATRSDFGSQLRWWRTTRRYSQLELASKAEISSRHLSFLETGRSRPSREMVVHLATVLDLPLRDGNLLLNAAGFAPVYSEFDLDAPEMEGVRSVLGTILDAHRPNPAVVVDRLGNLVDANTSAGAMMAMVVAPDSAALEPQPNLNRLTFHPDGIRARAVNWSELAASLLVRLQRERDHRPSDAELGGLVEEMLSYPDVAELAAGPRRPTGTDLIIPMSLSLDGVTGYGRTDTLSLLTTISTLGSPYDVTLDELRLETFFPVDPFSRSVVDSWGMLN